MTIKRVCKNPRCKKVFFYNGSEPKNKESFYWLFCDKCRKMSAASHWDSNRKIQHMRDLDGLPISQFEEESNGLQDK